MNVINSRLSARSCSTDRFDEVVFGAEIAVDRSGAEFGFGADLRHRRAVEAAAGEANRRRSQNLPFPFFRNLCFRHRFPPPPYE